MTRSLFVQAIVFGVLTGGVYTLMASGLSLYFGVMRIVQIAHPAFLFLGAYFTYSLHNALGWDPLLTLPITVPAFFLMGVTVQRLLLARLHDENRAMMSVLLTFSIAVVVEGTLSATTPARTGRSTSTTRRSGSSCSALASRTTGWSASPSPASRCWPCSPSSSTRYGRARGPRCSTAMPPVSSASTPNG